MKGQDTMDNEKITVTEPAEEKVAKHEMKISPLARIIESDKGYDMRLDMPGALEKTVEIGIENGVLSIDAVRGDEPVEGGHIVREEFPMADYHAAYEIPDRIDTENIKARLNCGVLSIFLPKRKEAMARKILLSA